MLMRWRRLRADGEAGVSLIELLMVIMMLSVIGGVVSTSLVTGMRVVERTQTRYDALAEMQRAVNRMARELRAADPVLFSSSNSATAVVESFRDAPAFTQRQRFTYTYCAATRAVYVRREIAPTVAWTPMNCSAPSDPILIGNIDNNVMTPLSLFTYQTVNGQPATSAAAVYRIRISMRRMIGPQTPLEVNTSVRVRNAR